MNFRKIRILLIISVMGICWSPAPAAGQKKSAEQKLYTVAKGAYRDGLYDIAIGQLKKFLTRYPKSVSIASAHLMLAESLYRKKDHSQAIAHYRQALQSHKSGLNKINYRLGECYYRTAKFSKAASAFSRIVRKGKEPKFYPDTLYLRAESLLKVGKYEEAGKLFQDFLEEFPKHLHSKRALFGLGWSQFQEKHFVKAVDFFERFIKKYPPIAQKARAQYLIAFSLDKLKKYPPAIAAYEKFLGRYPDNPRADEARLRVGLVCFETRFYAKAAKFLGKYILAHPQNADPYLFRIGLSYFRLKNYTRAQNSFTKLINDFPKSPLGKETLYHLGNCYLKQNKKKSALKVFYDITKKYPNTEIAKAGSLRIGILESGGENHQAAIAAFEVSASSKNPTLAAEAQYRLADATQKTQKPEQALIQFQKVIKNFPEQKDWWELAHLKVAESLVNLGDFKGAEEHLQNLSKYRKTTDLLLKKIKREKKKSQN